jgi:hypothetical protein
MDLTVSTCTWWTPMLTRAYGALGRRRSWLCIFVDVFFFTAWKQILGARLWPPLRLSQVEVDDVAHDAGWVDSKIFWRAISGMKTSTSWLDRRVAASRSLRRYPSQPKILTVIAEEVAGVSCHHAGRRAPNHPYLARQLSDCEMWTAHGGVNPCGLFVR